MRDGQRELQVNKNRLIESLQTNRKKHNELYQEAIKGWVARMAEILRDAADAAKKGKAPSFDSNGGIMRAAHERPIDHTGDYDEALQILDWTVGDVVTITFGDLQRYVNDAWQWKHDFNNAYANSVAHSR